MISAVEEQGQRGVQAAVVRMIIKERAVRRQSPHDRHTSPHPAQDEKCCQHCPASEGKVPQQMPLMSGQPNSCYAAQDGQSGTMQNMEYNPADKDLPAAPLKATGWAHCYQVTVPSGT